jgi:ribosomal-protein-alanine N-acetyltransferase
MATPALTEEIHIEGGSSDQMDAVMSIMDRAFGKTFGEAWTRSQLSGILPMAGVFLMLARDGASGEVVGFSLYRTVVDECELLLIAVHPSEHRRGIGTLLLNHFLERARKGKVARIHLEVREGNPAIGMYRAAGFSPVGRRRNYYHATNGKTYDAITLAFEF